MHSAPSQVSWRSRSRDQNRVCVLDLQQFILKNIDSVDHLRALLLLRGEPARAWGVTEVGARLNLQPRRAAAVLEALETAALLRAHGADPCYQYAPKDLETGRLAEELATLDQQRPVTLIKLIYSRPDVVDLSDASEFRNEY